VFLVTGQPGIGHPLTLHHFAEPDPQSGKSVFLIWLLMERLALGLPTALQTERNVALLFHDGGVTKFQNLDDPIHCEGSRFPTSSPAGRIWVLVDSNQRLFEPVPIFLMRGGPFFVVEAASPCEERLDWANKVLAELFHMETWSFTEVLQL